MDSRLELSPHYDELICPGVGFSILRAIGGYSNDQKTNL